MTIVDSYIKSKDKAALVSLASSVSYVIGPFQGVAATEAVTLEDGSFLEAQAAKGDPCFWYLCARSETPFLFDEDVLPCEESEGRAVCGVWA